MRGFPRHIVETLAKEKILAIRAGKKAHRFIGIWVVVAENRVFVRSWGLKAGGWYKTLLEDPRFTIKVRNRNVPSPAVRTKSERLKEAVSLAYREKYNTPWMLRYVRGFRQPKRMDATIELVPQ